MLLKVVNKSDVSESVNITLGDVGQVRPVGHATILTGAPGAENSFAHPTQVVPAAGTFPAASRFQYLFPAYSVTVLRIGVSRAK